jgi:hypothetical protein
MEQIVGIKKQLEKKVGTNGGQCYLCKFSAKNVAILLKSNDKIFGEKLCDFIAKQRYDFGARWL